MAEFGALNILCEGAIQAARNASTIAGCSGVSNRCVSQDGLGNTVADLSLNSFWEVADRGGFEPPTP